MFIMTSDIIVGKYKAVKPNAVKWKCSVSNYVDTCSIKLPLAKYLKSTVEGTEDVNIVSEKRTVFSEGDAVSVALGYNGDNTVRFKGFVNRINYGTPFELECEGYSYQIKKKLFKKQYTTVTIKHLLTDLIAGTDIKLSQYIPDVTINNITFKNTPGLKVLEWLEKECACTVFFDFDTLYAGAVRFPIPKPAQKLQLGWNTVEDKEFRKTIESDETQINIIEKTAKGSVKRTASDMRKFDNATDVKVRKGLPAAFLKMLANELQKQKNYLGYQGNITCFLIPVFEKSGVATISDNRFPERNGSYFVDTVEGSFDKSGGRQKVILRYYANAN